MRTEEKHLKVLLDCGKIMEAPPRYTLKICEKCQHYGGRQWTLNNKGWKCNLMNEIIDDDGYMEMLMTYTTRKAPGESFVESIAREQLQHCPYILEHTLESQQ